MEIEAVSRPQPEVETIFAVKKLSGCNAGGIKRLTARTAAHGTLLEAKCGNESHRRTRPKEPTGGERGKK